MSKLDNVKVFSSRLTNATYLASVNSKNVITDKRLLDEEEMIDFIFAITNTLKEVYGNKIKLDSKKIQINIEVIDKENKDENKSGN